MSCTVPPLPCLLTRSVFLRHPDAGKARRQELAAFFSRQDPTHHIQEKVCVLLLLPFLQPYLADFAPFLLTPYSPFLFWLASCIGCFSSHAAVLACADSFV